MKNRKNWIDIAKCIGISLVIIGHTNMGDRTYTEFIYSFHMPLFFIISGYLFHVSSDNKYLKFLKSNFKTLLVPYLIFGSLSILFALAFQYRKTHGIPDDFILKSLGGLFLGVGYNTEYTIMNNVPLWFLPAMFFVRQMYFFVNKLGNIFKKMVVCAIGLLIALGIKNSGYFLPFSIGAALSALPFFFIGNFLNVTACLDYVNKRKILTVVLFFISLITLCASFHFSTDMTDIANSSTNNVFLYLLMGVSGSLAVFFLCFLFDKFEFDFIKTISEGTLLIMCVHIYMYGVIFLGYKLFGLKDYFTIYGEMVTTFVMLILFYYPIKLCKQKCPLLLGKNTKKLKKS